jgi:excisionase family DNA binding protein
VATIIDIQTAAKLLAVDTKTVYRLIQSGDLPAAKIGRVYRLSQDDVEHYFEQRKAATMRAFRTNGKHARENASQPGAPTERRCAWCGRELVLNYSVAAQCEEPGCDAVICRACARSGDVTRCPAHAQAMDRHETIEQLRADGCLVVGRDELCIEAAAYLSEVAARLEHLSNWLSNDGAVVPRAKLVVTVRRQPSADAWLTLDDERPAPFEAVVAQRGRIRAGKTLLGLWLVPAVHRPSYTRHGFDVQPCTAGDIRRAIDDAVQSRKNTSRHVVAVWSATGWTEQASAQATAGLARGEQVVLVDRPSGRCIGADDALAYLLNPLPDEPTLEECEQFVHNELAVRSSVRLDALVDDGGFHREIAHRCFDRLAANGEYMVERFDDLGAVLTRR